MATFLRLFSHVNSLCTSQEVNQKRLLEAHSRLLKSCNLTYILIVFL